MRFGSRTDAGCLLGRELAGRNLKADIVVGLPRGGVVVAAEVARILQLPLDVIAVRKIGHPWHREFAVGALAEGGVTVLDKPALEGNPVSRTELVAVIAEETQRLLDYQARFHGGAKPELAGRRVVIVDDGLVTGATMEAAVQSARQQKAGCVVVAVPVASTEAVHRLAREADEVIALVTDPDFCAVGSYYREFSQTTDEEVLALLRNQGDEPPKT